MKKIIKIILLMFVISPLNCFAATGLIDIYSSNKSLTVGNSFTVTVYCKSSSAIGTCEYTLSYDSKKVKLTSGETSTLLYISNDSTYSMKKTFTFKAIANGSTTISAKAYGMIGFDEKTMTTSVSPVTVNISTPTASAPITYSTNNNLSNLSVKGYKLNETFNKDTIEYTLNLESSVEKITIEANKEDTKAKITGTGTYEVSEGDNTFKIVVTSEKGTTKTYTIKVSVSDDNPINVVIDDKTYTIIKRKSSLTCPEDYKETTINISGVDIPAFNNDITNYTLVGLKDNEGVVNLYIYDETNNTYKLFNELSFNSLKLNIIQNDLVPIKNLDEETIKINETEINAYKLNNNYYLIYGKNSATGIDNWYLYEKSENTIQLLNQDFIKNQELELEQANNLIILFSTSSFVLAIFLIISLCTRNKKKKKTNKKNKIDKNFLNDDLTNEKEITKNKAKDEKTQNKKENIINLLDDKDNKKSKKF